MTRRAPKGLWPAVTSIERVGFSRLRVYEHYGRDDAIAEALTRFHDEWWSRLGPSLGHSDPFLLDVDDPQRELGDLVGTSAARDYLRELVALATDVGLDRIPKVGQPRLVTAGYLPSGTVFTPMTSAFSTGLGVTSAFGWP
jgi:hypothetical protein